VGADPSRISPADGHPDLGNSFLPTLSSPVLSISASVRPLLPTSDPITRAFYWLTQHAYRRRQNDLVHLWHGHVLKAGLSHAPARAGNSFIDGAATEIFNLDASAPFSFRGGVKAGQTALPARPFFGRSKTLPSMRRALYTLIWIDHHVQVSPALDCVSRYAYKSVVHASYNRLFHTPMNTPSRSFIGNNAAILISV